MSGSVVWGGEGVQGGWEKRNKRDRFWWYVTGVCGGRVVRELVVVCLDAIRYCCTKKQVGRGSEVLMSMSQLIEAR